MIDIKHRKSDRVVLQVDSETLDRANLSGEYLIHANLQGASLRSASLLFANLSGADLSGADLTAANLRGANLTEVDLTGAQMQGANLAGATFSFTVLADCRSLHQALGLDKIDHQAPSLMDDRTLRASIPHLSDVFLRGAGYTQSEIRYLRARYSPGGGDPLL